MEIKLTLHQTLLTLQQEMLDSMLSKLMMKTCFKWTVPLTVSLTQPMTYKTMIFLTMTMTDISDDSHPDLLQLLQKWAITSNIPLVHINALIIILRYFFPNLPKYARTLVNTPKDYKIMDVPGGHYHHFGLAHGISERLDMHPNYVQENACIEFKVNIDGLPIFISTMNNFGQFWAS